RHVKRVARLKINAAELYPDPASAARMGAPRGGRCAPEHIDPRHTLGQLSLSSGRAQATAPRVLCSGNGGGVYQGSTSLSSPVTCGNDGSAPFGPTMRHRGT